jgi:hypothetical protein
MRRTRTRSIEVVEGDRIRIRVYIRISVTDRELDDNAAIKTLTDTWYRSVSRRADGT